MYTVPQLPLNIDLETKEILKKVAQARAALAELKGASVSIPNQSTLISTLTLQEAKDSSAIENIVTTHDDLYSIDSISNNIRYLAAKEVKNYSKALLHGYSEVQKTGLLTNNTVLQIQAIIEQNNAGYRKLPGTSLKNEATNEIVYTPPQHHDDITRAMQNLEAYINEENNPSLDPLINMAIIHHQFESIHPFYDGNGRTGRIINLLYIVKADLLSMPILYLSRYINKNKVQYYQHLQAVRDLDAWQDWVIFMLDGVQQTSIHTLGIISAIKELMLTTKQIMRTQAPKIYSQDLLNNIFKHPYTKTEYIVQDLNVTRLTASKYLDMLCKIQILKKHKMGKENYYINTSLYKLLANV